MEKESLLPKPTYGSIKRYMRRRRYQHLNDNDNNDNNNNKRKTKSIRLRRRPGRSYWRIKGVPKLTWVVVRSPLKMLAKLKNAYMNFMLRTIDTDNIFCEKRIPKARYEVSKNDEFEARLIFEISKALVASHELYPM
ncbi:hypothetical protein RJT34_18669 [Clitoria ternatea]|uniref:Uncharacterized protein n=1 Tax=Clitoria ternatea TaxID=43366 RepID=A0AAN9PG34_CLITE